MVVGGKERLVCTRTSCAGERGLNLRRVSGECGLAETAELRDGNVLCVNAGCIIRA